MTSRCGYDTIFQRVACAALVIVAIAFAVILTDVFVDIDGLLTGKARARNNDMPEPVFENEKSHMKFKSPNLIKPEYYKEENTYEEDSDAYRNKRSLETPNFFFRVKNPKMKNILTERLATLLEELDEEESSPTFEKKTEVKSEEKADVKLMSRNINNDVKSKDNERKKIENLLEALKTNNERQKKEDNKPVNKYEARNEEDMLHLAMHNILLQGIIGHMDLNDVFKKVHMLVRTFKEVEESPKENQIQTTTKPEPTDLQKGIKKIIKNHSPSIEENKFFEELTKCDKLQNDITDMKTKGMAELKNGRLTQKGPKLLIKTIIDITSKKDRLKDSVNSKENIKGIIKLIYNGKPIKFSRMEDDDRPYLTRTTVKPTTSEATTTDVTEKPNENVIEIVKEVDIPKAERFISKQSYFNQIIENYFQKYPKNFGDIIDAKNLESKRLKRQIKIRYENDKSASTTAKPKGDDDDELYVEIETHFDSKGMKGMKKKKLIRNIIDKIQKAIHSDLDLKITDDKKKKQKHLQVKKRVQNPLDKFIVNKIVVPIDNISKRHSDPILSKSSPIDKYADKSGETWRKAYHGPGFLTVSKSLNSAEMGEVDVDYNKVMAVNGIPQRLQKPLNTDVSEEFINAKTYFDMGNLKFFVKNIEGTGLSIGFNQYTDEPPDPDSIKLFTGIENLIQTYHRNTDEDTSFVPPKEMPKSSEEMEHDHELSKREINGKIKSNEHIIIRRSVKELHEKDYHSNEYKLIVNNNNYLPYENYQEIYEDKKKRVAITMDKQSDSTLDPKSDRIKTLNIKSLPNLMEDNIFYKKLEPSEILSLAALLDRKKRSMIIQKIKNIKNKVKLNRFINSRGISRKKIILNKKRNKREIDKIRIIATGAMPKSRHSEENIFLVDDGNVLADRAIIREIDTPDIVGKMEEKMPQEHYEMQPYDYEEPSYTKNVFDGRSRHNQLMSKYPHILLEEVGKSREDDELVYFNKYEVKPKISVDSDSIHIIGDNSTSYIEKPATIPKIDELVNAVEPKQNYKFTVKIFPKNNSDLNSGFKEIHTSINKSFNKDGLIYSSLVNVSEISKIEKLYKTTEVKPTTVVKRPTESAIVLHIQDQQKKMDILLKQHKQRIDEQLAHLNKERHNLDSLAHKAIENIKSIDRTNAKTTEPTILNVDPLSLMNKEDMSKFLASALFKLESHRTTSPTEFSTVTTETTVEPTTVEPVKLQLLNKIQKNENVTNQILHQINKNTEMLQTFLEKFTEKLTKEPKREAIEETPKFDYNMQNFWKPYHALPAALYQPQMQFGGPKNDSHFAIPFVYAYQQSFPMNNNFKPDIPVASVVYHGHIHADALKNVKMDAKNANYNQTDVNVADNDKNQTRYFLDTIESDFKVLPEIERKILTNKMVHTTTPRH